VRAGAVRAGVVGDPVAADLVELVLEDLGGAGVVGGADGVDQVGLGLGVAADRVAGGQLDRVSPARRAPRLASK
jgi:hypothetical protein